MDPNASNYDSSATVQATNHFGNIECHYASCDDIPEDEGCIFWDSFATFNDDFFAEQCAGYGGTLCTAAS